MGLIWPKSGLLTLQLQKSRWTEHFEQELGEEYAQSNIEVFSWLEVALESAIQGDQSGMSPRGDGFAGGENPSGFAAKDYDAQAVLD